MLLCHAMLRHAMKQRPNLQENSCYKLVAVMLTGAARPESCAVIYLITRTAAGVTTKQVLGTRSSAGT